MGGIPALAGTRMPVQTFIDYIKGGVKRRPLHAVRRAHGNTSPPEPPPRTAQGLERYGPCSPLCSEEWFQEHADPFVWRVEGSHPLGYCCMLLARLPEDRSNVIIRYAASHEISIAQAAQERVIAIPVLQDELTKPRWCYCHVILFPNRIYDPTSSEGYRLSSVRTDDATATGSGANPLK